MEVSIGVHVDPSIGNVRKQLYYLYSQYFTYLIVQIIYFYLGLQRLFQNFYYIVSVIHQCRLLNHRDIQSERLFNVILLIIFGLVNPQPLP